MKRFLLLLLLAPLTSHADLTFTQLEAITQTPETLSGHFVQEKYLSALDASLESSGEFRYLRNQSIQWITREPIQNELLMTPTSLVNTQGAQEVMRLDTSATPALKVISHLFFSVLTAEWQQLSRYFTLTGSLTQTLNNTRTDTPEGGQWHAELLPIDPTIKHVVSKVELNGSQLLREIILHEPGGDRTLIRFDHLTP
ncbi:outer membrane lipoprotein carrier protein LolA [Neptunomonas antarctica]|uniref:Outer membrane lipoprotein carrier protein LolA n=1 Tax=Neptunomonas antarctica TaxID=619304 RepID=A0A1N7IT09_9GAMM|nr:outer membrane lipoprotein carrier protein LolA [Neptunomonas antarctica]SIS40235.1 hypothetical protein SAMN05421760_10190 [Neptunomonas antarctica]